MKRTDPNLLSARQTVEIDLGCKGRLAGMELWTLWEIGWRGEGPVGEEILSATTALANPNRELAWLRCEDNAAGPPGPRAGSWRWCIVWDRAGAAAPHAFRVCERLLGKRNMTCEELVRAAVWGLSWGPAVEDPAAATRDVAIARSRLSGLLANPHVQAVQFFSETIPFPWWEGRRDESERRPV
jgi:hypothetical protein